MKMSLRLRRQIILDLLFLIFGLVIAASAACADTPDQTRQAIQTLCNRAIASYQRGDAAGFLANHSSGFVERSTAGVVTTLRQEQAWQMKHISKKEIHKVIHCRVSKVTLQGSQAKAVLYWEFITYHTRSSSTPAYTLKRNYEEQTIWQQSPHGWLESSSDETHDIL